METWSSNKRLSVSSRSECLDAIIALVSEGVVEANFEFQG